MSKAVVILSGGMDSTVLLAKAVSEFSDVLTLTFNYGSKHNARENTAAQQIAAKYSSPNQLISLPFINELFKSDLLQSGGEIPEGHYEDVSMKRTVVPFRNGIMLSIAAGYAESVGAHSLLYGAHAGDHVIYPDCRSVFINAIRIAIRLGTYVCVDLYAPFVGMTKREVGLLGKGLDVDYSMTYSCYKGGELHCGACGTCTERKEALEGFDPTIYEV